MAINVSDLPPKYQAQAMKKYMEQQKRSRHLKVFPYEKICLHPHFIHYAGLNIMWC